MLFFPEGTRTKDGKMAEFKKVAPPPPPPTHTPCTRLPPHEHARSTASASASLRANVLAGASLFHENSSAANNCPAKASLA